MSNPEEASAVAADETAVPDAQETARAEMTLLASHMRAMVRSGSMKYATLKEIRAFIESGSALFCEAMKLVEVRTRQSESGKSSVSRMRATAA